MIKYYRALDPERLDSNDDNDNKSPYFQPKKLRYATRTEG